MPDLLHWIQSYLCDRVLQDIIHGVLSQEKVLNYSVPQGSILDPENTASYTSPDDIIHQSIFSSKLTMTKALSLLEMSRSNAASKSKSGWGLISQNSMKTIQKQW